MCHYGWKTARACTRDSRELIVPENVDPMKAVKLRVEPGVSPVRVPVADDVPAPANGAAPAAMLNGSSTAGMLVFRSFGRALGVSLACPNTACGSLNGGVGVAQVEQGARCTDGGELGWRLFVVYESVVIEARG